MDREGLSFTIAKNITELRRAYGMTQATLAEKLGYSDKSVSKWERAEGIPDVVCLKNIAELFGVSVDYLLTDDHEKEPMRPIEVYKAYCENDYVTSKRVIVLISLVGVWILAAAAYIITNMCGYSVPIIFVSAAVVTTLLCVIFNAMWGNRKHDFYTICALVWSVLFLICYIFRDHNSWALMTLGIPATLVVWLSCRVKVKRIDRDALDVGKIRSLSQGT